MGTPRHMAGMTDIIIRAAAIGSMIAAGIGTAGVTIIAAIGTDVGRIPAIGAGPPHDPGAQTGPAVAGPAGNGEVGKIERRTAGNGGRASRVQAAAVAGGTTRGAGAADRNEGIEAAIATDEGSVGLEPGLASAGNLA